MRNTSLAVIVATVLIVPAKAGGSPSGLCFSPFQDVKSLVEDTTRMMEKLGLDVKAFRELLGKFSLLELLSLEGSNSGIDFSKPVCLLFSGAAKPWVVLSVTSKSNIKKAFSEMWGENPTEKKHKKMTVYEFSKKSKKILVGKGIAYISEAEASPETLLSYSYPGSKAVAHEKDAQVVFFLQTSDLSKVLPIGGARKVVETVIKSLRGIVSWRQGQLEIETNLGVLPQIASVLQCRESRSSIAQILGILPQTSTGFLALFLPLDAIVEALTPLLGTESWTISLLKCIGNDLVLFEEGGIPSLGVVLKVKDNDGLVKAFKEMCNALSDRCSFASKNQNLGFELEFEIGGVLRVPVFGQFLGDYLLLSFLDKRGLRVHGESLFLANAFVGSAITKPFVLLAYGKWGDFVSSFVPYLAVARHRFSESAIAYAGLADALLLLHDLMLDLGLAVSVSKDNIELKAFATFISLEGWEGANMFQDALQARYSGHQQNFKDMLLEVVTKGKEPIRSKARFMLTSADLLGDILGAAVFAALFGAKSSNKTDDFPLEYVAVCQKLVNQKCVEGALDSKECLQALQLLQEVKNTGSERAMQRCMELLQE